VNETARAAAVAANGPEVADETRWLIIWPNGVVYTVHDDEESARAALKALLSMLISYTVPEEYFPDVKRRRRTVTRSKWEDA
jgi:hypothetical protein